MPAPLPAKTLLTPVRLEQPAFKPMATLPVPEVFEKAALQPRAALVALVQPRTTPAAVGVAAAVVAGVAQQTAFRPLLIRTWPAVPQEAAQSMIPAPGLMALVLSPVNQLQVAEKPIESWQLPVVLASAAFGPIATLESPLV
jgi:hypothetical protein